MADEWQLKTLGEVGRVVTGKTPLTNCDQYFGGDIPFVTPSDMDGRRIISTTKRYLTGPGTDSVRSSQIPVNAVMVSCIGSDMGKAAIAGRDCVTNQQINSLIVEPANDHLFIYYNLSLRKNEFQTSAAGSAQPILNKSAFGRLSIVVPPPAEQLAISSVIGCLDDKIELNRNMNKTLEGMARALFKSWFVDFDPVRAKAEGSDPGLPPHIAALFPDSFVDSVVDEIPAGWKSGSLADYALLNPESWSKETRPDAIRYADLANTKWGKIEALAPYSRDDAPSRAQRVLRPGDTIVGTVRPGNGSYAMIDEDGITGSTGFAVLRPQAFDYREFVYLAATASDNIEALAHVADGGAYPAIRPEVVLSTPTVCPPVGIITAFAEVARPLLGRIAHNSKESRTLAAIRDLLLPKLISGDLRVAS